MKPLGIVAQFPDEAIWHLLQTDGQTCCGVFTVIRDKQGQMVGSAARELLAMVAFADLCPDCQAAVAKSKVSRAGMRR